MREQYAAIVVDQAFSGDPTHALHEAADDLPQIDAGVNRLANVHQDVDARHAQLAGEAIDFHFGNGRALRVVQKRIATARVAVVVDAGRGVEATGAEIDSFASGRPAK